MPATFLDFGTVETAPYRAAFRQAQTIINKAGASALFVARSKSLSSNALKDAKAAFARFFGDNDPNVVANHFGLLKKAALGDLRINYDDAPDEPGDKAWVAESDMAAHPGGVFTPDIYFNPALIKDYAALGTNSAAGTIVHEMSHLVLATEDHVYGMKSCSELPDDEKIENADNYKYYAELFQLRLLSLMPELSDDYDLGSRPPRKSKK